MVIVIRKKNVLITEQELKDGSWNKKDQAGGDLNKTTDKGVRGLRGLTYVLYRMLNFLFTEKNYKVLDKKHARHSYR